MLARLAINLSVDKIMEITWPNLLSLIEDFTGRFLAFRCKPEFVLSRNIFQVFD
jgi:hypothetical protein